MIKRTRTALAISILSGLAGAHSLPSDAPCASSGSCQNAPSVWQSATLQPTTAVSRPPSKNLHEATEKLNWLSRATRPVSTFIAQKSDWLRTKSRYFSLPAEQKIATQPLPWSATASMGYSIYENSYGRNGQTPVGRLAIGKDVYQYRYMVFGGEVGLQSGNNMPIYLSDAALTTLGGLPLYTTVQPMLDALATLKLLLDSNSSQLFAIVKGGPAYRQWQMTRSTVNNVSEVAGELQVGLGKPLTKTMVITLLYQGVYGSNPEFTYNQTSELGHVSHIPRQNGVLLSLSLTS